MYCGNSLLWPVVHATNEAIANDTAWRLTDCDMTQISRIVGKEPAKRGSSTRGPQWESMYDCFFHSPCISRRYIQELFSLIHRFSLLTRTEQPSIAQNAVHTWLMEFLQTEIIAATGYRRLRRCFLKYRSQLRHESREPYHWVLEKNDWDSAPPRKSWIFLSRHAIFLRILWR